MQALPPARHSLHVCLHCRHHLHAFVLVSHSLPAGFWYARASPAAQRWFNTFGDLQYWHDNGWEQDKWNMQITFFLWSMGDGVPPLRYGLLPPAHSCNLGGWHGQARLGLAIRLTVCTASTDMLKQAGLPSGFQGPS